MTSTNTSVSVLEGMRDYVSQLRGHWGDLPTRVEMGVTAGEGTWPAYQYHQALSQFGQCAADTASGLMRWLDTVQSDMVVAITDLEQTDAEAAQTLRQLVADLDGYATDLSATNTDTFPSTVQGFSAGVRGPSRLA